MFPIPNFKLCSLDNPDMKVFTDGSSFVRDGKRKAGYAVVTAEQVLETKSLPQGTSAQLVELVALTRALELSKGQQVNIYTDSDFTGSCCNMVRKTV